MVIVVLVVVVVVAIIYLRGFKQLLSFCGSPRNRESVCVCVCVNL